jgi:hypothetical protein
VNSTRRIALVTGVLFIITFIAAIPAQLVLYDPVLNDPDYIVGAGADTRVFWGALLEVIPVIANIGTAVVLYPIVKRRNEGVALDTSPLVSLSRPSSWSASSASYRS